jgi:hypothetical protein
MSGTHHNPEEQKPVHNKITTNSETHCVQTHSCPLILLLPACYVTAGLYYCHLQCSTSLNISIKLLGPLNYDAAPETAREYNDNSRIEAGQAFK